MSHASRYRRDGDASVIDVRVHRVEQLFDNRDPAPFRERDLEPELSDYLLEAGEDLLDEPRFQVVFWVDEPAAKEEIAQAYRAHFEDRIHHLKRRRARVRRTAQLGLLFAACSLIALLSVAQLVGSSVPGFLGAALREGLIVSGWVLLWRPMEMLVYDWIPVRRDRRIAARLLEAEVDVRRPEST
jgi:hypothetical protein